MVKKKSRQPYYWVDGDISTLDLYKMVRLYHNRGLGMKTERWYSHNYPMLPQIHTELKKKSISNRGIRRKERGKMKVFLPTRV